MRGTREAEFEVRITNVPAPKPLRLRVKVGLTPVAGSSHDKRLLYSVREGGCEKGAVNHCSRAGKAHSQAAHELAFAHSPAAPRGARRQRAPLHDRSARPGCPSARRLNGRDGRGRAPRALTE
ncbi:hypothetical protein NDU88_000743 [Pleurodeles waltl]|uniref:Uncharacterized protein n=1 Tax=Pleurodeles waltl TaxID=8319 RepID=A0AAV7KNH6_PLEWA|nr:hypothetical protein NDU88_000743 [Pleurodeles waltl]